MAYVMELKLLVSYKEYGDALLKRCVHGFRRIRMKRCTILCGASAIRCVIQKNLSYMSCSSQVIVLVCFKCFGPVLPPRGEDEV